MMALPLRTMKALLSMNPSPGVGFSCSRTCLATLPPAPTIWVANLKQKSVSRRQGGTQNQIWQQYEARLLSVV
jgi:hypothetical protein